MITSNTNPQILSAFLVLQSIAFVAPQLPAGITQNSDNSNLQVSTEVEDYIQENRRQYNATLQSYLGEINKIRRSLVDQLEGLDKQKHLLLNTIQETNEEINPLQVLSLQLKYCIQKYNADLPYAAVVKDGIEACISGAQSSFNGIVSDPSSIYNKLNNYYNNEMRDGLIDCEKTYVEPSLNYTLCVTSVIAKANTYTNVNRKDFANAIKMSTIKLNERINATATCTFNYHSDALKSIGAATHLIHDCIDGFLENRTPEPCLIQNSTTTSTQNNTTIHNTLEELDVRQELDKETSYSAAKNYSAT